MSVPELNSPTIEASSQCTDHMIIATWNLKTGWADPELKPYSNFSISPTASCLHYATQCFEGLKMYRGYDGALRLFRPNLNCERLLISSSRISLPKFDPKEIEKLIIALAAFDGPKWLPKSRPGSCLYLRPCMMGTDAGLGVATPKEVTFFIIATFMPPVAFPHGLRLLADEKVVRAWPGGFGYAKLGANYGPGLMATLEAKKKGLHQVLWLFDGIVTEAGASNFFVVWKHPRTSKLQLITAPFGEQKLILDGVTRRSILQLARERLSSPSLYRNNNYKDLDSQHVFEPLEIVERNFSIDELTQAINENRVLEAFSSGTAYFVSPVHIIHYKNQDYQIPEAINKGESYCELFKTWLMNIMYGKEAHEWAVIIDEKI
ncbi:Branched-chain-amino-acid aminotransferase [Erysiphe neolycopersici]|uniref:Branched-chain-amino-acid aminotransferase n=1 Tax=Erysiphe neolycopersici TaxID=212602 RepID=A0A420HP75_9PEZI|nr:Branched-chain-amino-acid aminotransferase [Erysiphe neolycopersici]